MDYFNHSNRHMYRQEYIFYTFRTRNAPVRGTMFIHSEQQNAYSERYIKKGRLFILTFQSNEFCSFCTNSLDKKIINHFQQTPEL